MLERFLLLWLVLSSALAFAWTRLLPGVPDPFGKAISGIYLPWLIVVTMFAIGWMLPRDEIRQVAKRWPMVLCGTAVQYLTMPTLAYIVARLCGFQGDLLIGMVMVGAVPGAMASNVLTLLARGNASFSVSLTTLATLLSPLAVPLAMQVFLHARPEINGQMLWNTCRDLLTQVVLPVLAGYSIGQQFPRWEATARRVGSTVANLAILLIIAAVVGRNRDRIDTLPMLLLVALLVVNLLGYTAGWLVGSAIRLPVSMRRALTLEVGMQNAGLGAVLATQLFGERPEIALPPALYTFGCMLTGTVLARWWSTQPLEDVDKGDRHGNNTVGSETARDNDVLASSVADQDASQ